MNTVKHKATIAQLQRHGRWLVDGTYHHITMTKKIGSQACSVVLDRQENGGYMIRPVTYKFRSVVSHFDYNQEEDRWARNKNAFRALIKTLKQCEVWGSITNKNFLQINNNNKKSKKTKLASELAELVV
jgi:hypothetical protein